MDSDTAPQTHSRQSFFLMASAVLGALAVMTGAFGAHGLESRLDTDMLEVYETGVKYHFYHALAMLVVSAAFSSLWSSKLTSAACWSFLLGIVIFSGTLYALAVTGIEILGAVTPIGGVLFIVGWVLLAVAASKTRPD